jgi:hypothetical protein
MQILTINNQNFQKPSRNPSPIGPKWRFWGKNFLYSSSKKFGSAYTQSPRKCSNMEILAKIEGKEANFFSKIYEGHIRIWFRSKKFKIISCLCTFKLPPTELRWCLLIYAVQIYRACDAFYWARMHLLSPQSYNALYWAMLHPTEICFSLLSCAETYWAMLYPILSYASPCWSVLHPWATLNPADLCYTPELRWTLLSIALPSEL